jgi:uncharacterized protein YukE
MAEKITIDPDLLRTHAARVEQVAGDVAMARDAAGSINLGGGAFGLMCNFLVLPATVVSTMAQSALLSAGSMVQRSATEIRAVATDFETTEGDIEQTIAGLRSALGS